MDILHPTQFLISGSLIKPIEINEEETLCSSKNQGLSIGVANPLKKFENAMDTCEKISRNGARMTEIKTKNEFQHLHNELQQNNVRLY